MVRRNGGFVDVVFVIVVAGFGNTDAFHGFPDLPGELVR